MSQFKLHSFDFISPYKINKIWYENPDLEILFQLFSLKFILRKTTLDWLSVLDSNGGIRLGCGCVSIRAASYTQRTLSLSHNWDSHMSERINDKQFLLWYFTCKHKVHLSSLLGIFYILSLVITRKKGREKENLQLYLVLKRSNFSRLLPEQLFSWQTLKCTLERTTNADPLIYIVGKYLPMNTLISSHASFCIWTLIAKIFHDIW